MGFLDRFRSKKEPAAPAEPPKMHKVTVNLPSYFKAGNGEYHFFVDEQENICKPFSKLDIEVSEGKHVFRVFSTPETLADVSEEVEITEECQFSVTVNVKDRTLSINSNDKLRSHKEFREEFIQKNGVKKE
ncbi:MAG: hypothetical protein MJZ21_04120 [archaeon]|nr:hypothetical protein [archaeon]